MTQKLFTLTLFFLALLFVSCNNTAQKTIETPNILFIMADDLGAECLGAYGGESYKTPRLDQMCAEGLKFTHCFSETCCSPSRAQLLTGRYPHLNGMTMVIHNLNKHINNYTDPNKEVSFAQQLKKQGYRTAIAGKWQLSFLNRRNNIHQLGFDEYCCWQIFKDKEGRHKSKRFHTPFFNKNGKILHESIKDKYGPDVLCDFLIDFMGRDNNKPFMAYYTAMLPHFPWVPTPDSANPDEADKKLAATDHGIPKYFPDMVNYLDKNVGRLLDFLKASELEKNTLVIFTGDNGTDQRLVSMWKGKKLKGGKFSLTDRGTRVPLIVRWPGKVKAGTVCHDLVDFSDFLPTFCELSGAALPRKNPLSGQSFLPQILGKKHPQPRQWVFYQRNHEWMIRGHKVMLDNKGQVRHCYAFGENHSLPVNTDKLDMGQKRELKLLKDVRHELFNKN